MAIEEEFSIEIPDKEADSIHSGMFALDKRREKKKEKLTASAVDKAVEYILNHPDAK